MPGERIRIVVWWIYYGLFLGLCIFILIMVIRYAVGWAYAGYGKLTGAQILYGAAVGMMIFGLLSLCIAYLTKAIYSKVNGNPHSRRRRYYRPSRAPDVKLKGSVSEFHINDEKDEEP